jgi:excisionase family DNA binding protein
MPKPKKTEITRTKTDRKPRKDVAPADAPSEDMEMSKDLTQYVTTKQAAEMLGVTQDFINALLIKGKLRGVKPGGWNWLVYAPSVQKYLDTKSDRGRPTSRTPKLNSTN